MQSNNEINHCKLTPLVVLSLRTGLLDPGDVRSSGASVCFVGSPKLGGFLALVLFSRRFGLTLGRALCVVEIGVGVDLAVPVVAPLLEILVSARPNGALRDSEGPVQLENVGDVEGGVERAIRTNGKVR